jgi:AraC-like DNA-binding protein
MSATPWTDSEDAIVREHYAADGVRGVQALLPARSAASIHHRARRLNSLRRRRWTAADDAKLRSLWTGELCVREIASAIGRSAATTYWRAQQIGLPLGVPDGWEYLTTSAERVGFCVSQLRRILAAAQVPVRPVLARPSEARGRKARLAGKRMQRHRYGMVWPADVDAAVQDWLECDTVEKHAERLGVSRETLSRRLRALGGVKPGGKRHWRVTDAEARAALEAKLVRTRERGLYVGAHYAEARP